MKEPNHKVKRRREDFINDDKIHSLYVDDNSDTVIYDHFGWLGSGVKDKNGVEIFEGDLVKDKDGDICSVQFKRGCFCIAEEPLDVDFSTGVGIAVDLEVIGHIAEEITP